MGTFSDKRTLAGLTSGAAATYPHGLGKIPDEVKVRFIATLATNTNWFQVVPIVDINNVTLQNVGATTSPNMEVVASVLHTIIT
jgi:hypothetical protein